MTLTHWETGNTLLLLLLNDILQCTLYHIDFCYVTLTYKFKQLFYYDNRNNKCPCTYPLEFWTIEKNLRTYSFFFTKITISKDVTFINGFEMSWEKTPEKYEIKISVKMTTKAIILLPNLQCNAIIWQKIHLIA